MRRLAYDDEAATAPAISALLFDKLTSGFPKTKLPLTAYTPYRPLYPLSSPKIPLLPLLLATCHLLDELERLLDASGAWERLFDRTFGFIGRVQAAYLLMCDGIWPSFPDSDSRGRRG